MNKKMMSGKGIKRPVRQASDIQNDNSGGKYSGAVRNAQEARLTNAELQEKNR